MEHIANLLQVATVAVSNVVPLPTVSFDTFFISIANLFLDVAGGDYHASIERATFLFKFFSVFLTLLFIAGTIYAKVQVIEIEHRLHSRILPQPKKKSEETHDEEAIAEAQKQALRHARWQQILDHAASSNPNDWRLAILEADIILDDMLKEMGAMGDTLGERLKSMHTNTMPKLQMAWEAHLVRNSIAHEGANFELSQHEARRVIGLFESVLKDGRFI